MCTKGNIRRNEHVLVLLSQGVIRLSAWASLKAFLVGRARLRTRHLFDRRSHLSNKTGKWCQASQPDTFKDSQAETPDCT